MGQEDDAGGAKASGCGHTSARARSIQSRATSPEQGNLRATSPEQGNLTAGWQPQQGRAMQTAEPVFGVCKRPFRVSLQLVVWVGQPRAGPGPHPGVQRRARDQPTAVEQYAAGLGGHLLWQQDADPARVTPPRRRWHCRCCAGRFHAAWSVCACVHSCLQAA
eukprot:366486-Chlamydomonas_euryale.AAC.4